jgi:hypothetical protein
MMTEVKAFMLVLVGTCVSYLLIGVGLLLLGGGGEALAVAMVLVLFAAGFVNDRLMSYCRAQEERRQREEILLR